MSFLLKAMDRYANQPEFRRAKGSQYNVFIPLKGERSLVYNTASQGFALWGEGDLDLYRKAEEGEVDLRDNRLRDLRRGGYLVPEDRDELEMLHKQYQAYRTDPGVMNLTIMPNSGCNFGCDYCFQGADKPNDMMPQEVQDAIVAHVDKHAPNLRRLSIAWYGGEPLIGRKTIVKLSERLIEVCKKHKIGYGAMIVTNGWFLDKKVAEALYKVGVGSAQVTLDGPDSDHDQRRHLLGGRGTFDRIIRNLKEVVDDVPIHFNIRVNVDSRNKDGIYHLIDQLEENGLANKKNFLMYFAPVEAMTEGCHSCSDVTMTKEQYGDMEAEFYRYALDKGLTPMPAPPRFLGVCVAARPNGFVITPMGDLHKCWDTVSWQEMSVGSILEPEKVEDSELWHNWNRWTPFSHETCRSCTILPNCAGMCAYKTVHSDKTMGEISELPCPSWKYNMKQRLFLRAEKLGLVKREDWDSEGFETELVPSDAAERWAKVFDEFKGSKPDQGRSLPVVG